MALFSWTLLVGMLVQIHGRSFLESSPVTADDAESSLVAEMTGKISSERLTKYEAELRATYTALPKNANGNIDHQVVRYVLHRFFVQRYGWYINGLEPNGDTFHVSASTTINSAINGWVPSYLQEKIERRLDGHGFDLHELAAFAVTLEDLVRLEASRRLEEIYNVLQLDSAKPIQKSQADDAITTYLMIYLVGRNVSLSNPGQAQKLRQLYVSKYTGWNKVDAWMHGVEQHLINTSSADGIEFPVVSQVVHEMGEQFGTFNNRECQELKTMLMSMQGKKAGRVSILDFYNMSLYSHWKFTERPEYLRDLGALDESDPSKPPLVLLPNYLSSAPNCLRATDLYAVCCPNECEPLLARLEESIGKPTASVDQLSSLVASLASPTVAARGLLPEGLRRRLEEIAAHHGGQVNLHGRLFAQWMHHAFPNECPFPHEAGTTNPQTADEWLAANGKDSAASEDERQKYIEDACAANDVEAQSHADGAQADEELPWSHAEELLVGRSQQGLQTGQRPRLHLVRGLLCLGIAVSAVFALEQAKIVIIRRQQMQTLIGLCVLASVAITLDLLDRRVFFLSLAGGLVFVGVRFLSGRHSCSPIDFKEDKCMA